jgi:ABC-type multidrug transport system fused ATPase/permease subunit
MLTFFPPLPGSQYTASHRIQLRIGAVAAIYFKSLKLDSVGGSKTVTAGELSNLASNDVERFLFASLFLTYLVWAPLEMLAVLFVGIRHLGPAFAAGYGVLFTFVLAQFFLGQQFAKFRSRTAVATDQRVSLVSQAIQGVRIMKMSGWELQFAKSIENAREKEILTIQKASRYKALNEAIYFVTNVSVAIVVLMVHVLTGNLLTPQNVFTTFSLINLIQFTMTKFFAYAVMSVSECYVSVRRIQQFLELPEIEEKECFVPETDRGRDSPLVSIHGVSAYWDLTTETGASATALNSHFVKNHYSPNIGVPLTSKSRTPSPVPSGSSQRGSLSTDGSQKSAPHLENSLNDEHASVPADDEANSDRRPNRKDSFSSRKSRESIVTETTQRSVALENVSLELNKGQLYCVIGSVGCGKSSLLSMLAGELLPNVGDIVVRTKSIAYAAQDPWMMDGTVRENITMGKEFNADFYLRVIEACGLRPDIERFPSGDQTLVGDRGVQCSKCMELRTF